MLKSKILKDFKLVKLLKQRKWNIKYLKRGILRKRRWLNRHKKSYVKSKKNKRKIRYNIAEKSLIIRKLCKLKIIKNKSLHNILSRHRKLTKKRLRVSTKRRLKKKGPYTSYTSSKSIIHKAKVKLKRKLGLPNNRRLVKRIIRRLRKKLKYRIKFKYRAKRRVAKLFLLFKRFFKKLDKTKKILRVFDIINKRDRKKNTLIRKTRSIIKLGDKLTTRKLKPCKKKLYNYKRAKPKISKTNSNVIKPLGKNKTKKEKKYKVSKRTKKYLKKLRRKRVARIKRTIKSVMFKQFMNKNRINTKLFHSKTIKKYAINTTKKILSKIITPRNIEKMTSKGINSKLH
jgi:hypothetical protein